MSETNKGQPSEQSTQDDVPPSPLELEIKFIPDRCKEGIGAADVPPIPSSLEMEGVPAETDISPIPLPEGIKKITPDRTKEDAMPEPDTSSSPPQVGLAVPSNRPSTYTMRQYLDYSTVEHSKYVRRYRTGSDLRCSVRWKHLPPPLGFAKYAASVCCIRSPCSPSHQHTS
jgi:hypothetical protein